MRVRRLLPLRFCAIVPASCVNMWMLVIIAFSKKNCQAEKIIRRTLDNDRKSAHKQPTANSQQRNLFLDVAKGIAIILVVIGHEIQHRYGTEVLLFRLIYSFHMPLFMLLAGMVFSLKFHDFPSQGLNTSREIIKSVRGLLVPYIFWTLIHAAAFHRDSMLSYIQAVIKSPDASLWFLFVLFLYRIFFVIIHAVCKKSSVIMLASLMIVIFVLVSAASMLFCPDNFTAFGLFRAYFPYFAAGFFVYQYRERFSGFLDSIPLNAAMLVMFVIVAPCWYLVIPNPFSISHGEIFFRVLRRVLPIPGIFLMMSLVKLILRSDFRPLINALSFTGKKTLGIYAIHFFFLGIFPPVILPLSASLILTVIIEKIPLIRSLLLGK